MNKNDLRYIKTDRLIIDVFMNCVNEVGFDKTSISMICSNALISRNTFYLHYVDKYDLLKNICTILENNIIRQLDDSVLELLKVSDFTQGAQWIINIVTENKKTIRTLLQCARPELCAIIERTFIDIPGTLLFKNYHENLKDPTRNYNKTFVLSSMMDLIEIIVNRDPALDTDDISFCIQSLCSIHNKLFVERIN